MKKITSLLLSFVMLFSLTLSMGTSVFAAASETADGIRYVEIDEDTVKIIGYSGTDENVVIPEMISGKKVTGISNNSFYNSAIKSLSIPASVTEIDDMAFINCANLSVINVASDNKNYDSRNNCNAVIEKATGILIAGCKNTAVPNGVTKISKYAFYGCNGLTKITLPESVKSIQHQSFQDCVNLKDITFLNKNCSICESCKVGDKTCSSTISKSATIHGYKGSTAERYAKDYGRKFADLPESVNLATPKLNVTVNTNGTFTLSWAKVSGAEKYELYIKQSDGSYKVMKTTTATSFITAVGDYGKQYSYKMKAVKGNAKSAFSSVVNATNKKKLQTPTMKATVNANGTFKLYWSAVAGAEKYELYIKQANGSYKLMKTTTATSFTTAFADYGKQFSYKMRAVTSKNSSAASNYSAAVNATNKKKLQTPTMKATVNSNGTFKLYWSAVAGAEKYELYIRQANGSYKLMKTTTATSFTTAFADYGKQFSYKMRAVTSKNSSAASNYSAAVNATNKKKLQTPTMKAAVNKNGSFKLSWNKVAGATSYQIYIKQSNGSYKLMKTTTSTSFTTAVATKGRTYSYKVRAVVKNNSSATSNYSSAVSVKRK